LRGRGGGGGGRGLLRICELGVFQCFARLLAMWPVGIVVQDLLIM
jgi:hypothetical protein